MIVYVILFALAIHYSWPGLIFGLCIFGMGWEIAKSIGRSIEYLSEDEE
jgi:F0F1-type ATP synthase membrane subunit c/vacuolar-type H+-ATPase subunit K